MCHDFCTELHQNKTVSDATQKAAFDKFGERGVIDLVECSQVTTRSSPSCSTSIVSRCPRRTPPPLQILNK